MGEFTVDDAAFMRRAISLAWSAKPAPNPRVGSVVVRDGRVIGEARHVAVGHAHAEIAAMAAAGDATRGATVYVTLEPCNHYGRTPPCTEALLRAGVARVVIGVRDPNPRVQGGGFERLRDAGVDVVTGVESAACERLIRPWRKHVTTGLPYVLLKVGMSLDGRIATRLRESRWITSDASRRDAHAIRARVDAILVGIGTVLADDPLLTPRDVHVEGALPVRVVLDTHLRTPLDSNLVRTAHDAPVLVLHRDEAPEERRIALRAAGVETIAIPTREGHVALVDALRVLGERGIVELLVEGGGAVHGALFDEHLADGLLCYMAPMIIGGRDAFPAFGGLGAGRLDEAHRLHDVSVDRVGDDVRITAEIEHVHGHHHSGR